MTLALSALALTALGGIGAGAAQAYQTVWYVEGVQLTGAKAFTLTGPDATFTFYTAGGTTMQCGNVSGTGQIKAPSGGSALLTWSECEFTGGKYPFCQVQPIEMQVNIDVVEEVSPARWVERFTLAESFMFKVKNLESKCFWWAEEMKMGGGGALGAEVPILKSKALKLQGLSGYTMNWLMGSEHVTAYMEGPMTQSLTSAEKYGLGYAL